MPYAAVTEFTADLLVEQQRFEEALPLYKEAKAIRVDLLGKRLWYYYGVSCKDLVISKLLVQVVFSG